MSGAMIAGMIADTLNNVWGNINDSVQLGMQEKIAQQQLDLAEKQYYSNIDIMNKNFGLQQEAFNYNKQQAELTRIREDNAFQRRVEDYTKAGFSPLSAQGVASSSSAPVLSAPQLDPQGVNQAVQNRLSAYDKKMQVYQNKLNQSNINAEMRLKNMQLSLAQIETAKGIFESVYNTKKTGQEVRRLELENDYYQKHGFKDTTFKTLISDILKNVNFGGKTPGEVVADSINDTVNNSASSSVDNFTKLKRKISIDNNVSRNNAISNPKKSDFDILINNKLFNDTLTDIKKMSKWSNNTTFRKEKVQKLLNSLNIHYDKDLFSKSVLSNSDVYYLQNLLINYRKQILGQ